LNIFVSMTDLIGKRIRVVVGDKIPEDKHKNAIIGDDNLVHVTSKEAKNYDNIIGEKIEVSIGDIDKNVKEIVEKIEKIEHPKKEEIVSLAKEILKEQNKQNKNDKIRKLIEITKNISIVALNVQNIMRGLGFPV